MSCHEALVAEAKNTTILCFQSGRKPVASVSSIKWVRSDCGIKVRRHARDWKKGVGRVLELNKNRALGAGIVLIILRG